MSFKRGDVPFFQSLFLLLPVSVIARAPAALFDYEVILEMKAMGVGATDEKKLT